MIKYAVYRILYGECFIQESIKSIEPYMDKIFVFWTNKVLGNTTECTYKGDVIKFPRKIDNVINKIYDLGLNKKVILVNDYVENNDNQFTHLVNDLILPKYKKPDRLLFIEPDHVFRNDQLELAFQQFDKMIKDSDGDKVHASTSYVELWKTPYYRTVIHPNRYRLGSMLWTMDNLVKIPKTYKHAQIPKPSNNPDFVKAYVHDFGFCVSEESMFWKHLTAIGFSQKIEDTPPIESWYEDVWLNWKFEEDRKNLHMSVGYEHLIPNILPYDVSKLPQIIKNRYGIKA